MVGLIVVFPLLGHATWHAYKAMKMMSSLAQRRRVMSCCAPGVEAALLISGAIRHRAG